MTRHALLVPIFLIGFVPAVDAALTQQQLCESAMDMGSAKYAECRLTAESTNAKKPDSAKLMEALETCSTKFGSAFSRLNFGDGMDFSSTKSAAIRVRAVRGGS